MDNSEVMDAEPDDGRFSAHGLAATAAAAAVSPSVLPHSGRSDSINIQPRAAIVNTDRVTEGVHVGRDLHVAERLEVTEKHIYKKPVIHQQIHVSCEHNIEVHADDSGGYAQLKDQSKAEINFELDLFVKTNAYRLARLQLEASGILVITGPPGCGKSTIGRALLRDQHDNQGLTPLVLHHWREWRSHVGGHHGKQAVLIDDVFGKDAFTRGMHEVWSNLFPIMQTFAAFSPKPVYGAPQTSERRKCLVVFTVRKNVLDQVSETCQPDDAFLSFPVLDLGETELLTDEEKSKMLRAHVGVQGKLLPDNVLQEILTCDRSGPVFPLCCREFAKIGKDSTCQSWIFKFSEHEGGADNLHMASRLGVACLVSALIHTQVAVDGQDSSGMTPLHHACANGHLQVVKILIGKEADVEATDMKLWRPLHHASLHGHSHIISFLIRHRATVDAEDRLKRTPLYLACQKGRKNAASVLLSHGADPARKSFIGWTPLHVASYRRQTCVVEVLLKRRALVNMDKPGTVTPLHVACSVGRVETVTVLLQNGARTEVKNGDGWTPLHVASAAGHVGNVRALLDRNAELEAKEESRGTPLHLASQHGRIEVVKVLLAKGASVDAKSIADVTPLHLASLMGHHLVVEVLLTHNAQANAREKDGWAPLHMACVKGHACVVRCLLSRGAGAEVETKDGRTAINLAHPEVRNILSGEENASSRGKPVPPPKPPGARACRETTPQVLKVNGCTPIYQPDSTTPQNGETTFNGMTAQQDLQCVETHAVVRKSARECAVLGGKPQPPPKPQRTSRNSYSGSPLHIACSKGDADLVIELLQDGADPLTTDDRGDTPLHVACRRGNIEVAQILLLHNTAAVDVRNNIGERPVDLAINGKHEGLVNYLLDF